MVLSGPGIFKSGLHFIFPVSWQVYVNAFTFPVLASNICTSKALSSNNFLFFSFFLFDLGVIACGIYSPVRDQNLCLLYRDFCSVLTTTWWEQSSTLSEQFSILSESSHFLPNQTCNQLFCLLDSFLTHFFLIAFTSLTSSQWAPFIYYLNAQSCCEFQSDDVVVKSRAGFQVFLILSIWEATVR